MNIVFNNNNIPYRFSDDSCGGGKHLSIRYREVVSIRLDYSQPQSNQKGFFGRLFGSTPTPIYTIVITYYPTWHDKTKTDNKVIAVTSSEVQQAKEVVDFVSNDIAKRIKQAEIDSAKQEQTKKTDTIDVTNENGEIEKVWRRQTFFGNTVLIADGGSAYHTHADCFESWLDSYKAKFTGWKQISLADAKAQGYTPCKKCEKYYDFEDEE